MPSAHSQHEHEGRVPQVGVPTGPRQTIPARPSSPAAEKPVYHPASETYVPGATARGESPSAAGKKAARRATANAKAKERRTRALALTKKPKAKKPAEKPVLKQAKAKKIQAKAPKTKPVTFEGHKTAGTPTLAELKVAKAKGTLKVGKHNFATTPKVRKAARGLKKAKRAIAKNQKSRGPLPGLGPEESRNAKVVLRKGEKSGADHKELLAAAETGIVESGFKNYRNQAETDADSLGWRQERVSQYGADATNVKKGAKNFFTETKTDTGGTRGAGMTAGQLAQTVQGSAFPERYDQVKPQAQALLSAYKQGKATPKQVAQLKVAKARAAKAGLKVEPKGSAGPPPKKVVKRYKAALIGMKELEKGHLPYSWGGGHASFAPGGEEENGGAGYDCSGAVSYMLHKAGVLKAPLTSGDMGSVLKPGPGAVTVFYNGVHTFAYIAPLHKYWGTSESNPGGGAGFFPKSVGDAEVASGNSGGAYQVGHVPGLGQKQAVQLGAGPSATSFPGMNLSSSGTTATIEQGAGATVEKPGFSKKPIQLTPSQKAHRTFKKLKSLGVGQETPTTESKGSAPTSELERLKKKYATVS